MNGIPHINFACKRADYEMGEVEYSQYSSIFTVISPTEVKDLSFHILFASDENSLADVMASLYQLLGRCIVVSPIFETNRIMLYRFRAFLPDEGVSNSVSAERILDVDDSLSRRTIFKSKLPFHTPLLASVSGALGSNSDRVRRHLVHLRLS